MATYRLTDQGHSDLFEYLELPSPPLDASAIGLQADQLRADWTIDKDDFVEFLCLHTMGMSLMVPDFDWMKNAIGTWSRAHIHEWQRMFDTLFYKYNPLWNKDGRVTDSGWDHRHGENSGEGHGGSSADNTETGYTHGYDGGTTHTDDNLAWTHADKTKGSNTGRYNDATSGEATEQSSYNHTRLEQGNIGVTMSQELITKERELAMFSIDEFIADEFKKQFCLMLW